MIACGVTKDFGVLASDSAQYVADSGETTFETVKLSFWREKYLLTFIGTSLYFSRIDQSKFDLPLDGLSLYLQDYLRGMRADVAGIMKETITDVDENQPHFCLYVLGVHGKIPTLAQFNSFLDFKPKYLWTKEATPKFSTLIFGDDSKPEKQEMFKEASRQMDLLAQNFYDKGVPTTPGIVGEILTRGIHHKADKEMTLNLKKKYAGGMVNAAVVKSDGMINSLSGLEFVNGNR